MDAVIEFTTAKFSGIPVWNYLISLLSILLGFAGMKIVDVILGRLIRLSKHSKTAFDDVIFLALLTPLKWIMALGGIFIALTIFPFPVEPVNIVRFIAAMRNAVIISLVIWFVVRLADGFCDIWAKKAALTETKLDDQLVPIVKRSVKFFLYIVGLVLILQNLGYSVGSLLAGLGIGSLGFALASRDMLSNLFGSFVIFLDKPFQVDDWIEMGDIEGTVEEVGLRTTRVRTFANSLITVPNALFTTQSVNNWSQMKKRRIKMTIGVSYSSSPEKLDELVLGIRKIIKEDEKLRDDFSLVNFDKFGPYSLDIFVYCFTTSTVWAEFLQAKQEFMLKIIYLVNDLGLQFAFPTQTVHVESKPDKSALPQR